MPKISVTSYGNPQYSLGPIRKDGKDELFISCVSYEQRSVGVLGRLDKGYRAHIGLFVVNEEFLEFRNVKANMKRIKRILRRSPHFDHRRDVLSSIDNPVKVIMEIDKTLKNRLGDRSRIDVTFDMTTFPRCELLAILYYIRHLSAVDTIRVLYISPDRYGIWLSEGYRHSIIPPFFEGPPTFGKRTALLILTGFEYERAVSLIDDLEPSAVILGKPSPGTAEDFKDGSSEIIKKLARTRRVTKIIHDVPGNDPFLCKNAVRGIIESKSSLYDFFVAPLGTKLEALGVYLAYEENPDFRIVYPVPLVYNVGGYSFGCRDIYEMTLRRNRSPKESRHQ